MLTVISSTPSIYSVSPIAHDNKMLQIVQSLPGLSVSLILSAICKLTQQLQVITRTHVMLGQQKQMNQERISLEFCQRR